MKRRLTIVLLVFLMACVAVAQTNAPDVKGWLASLPIIEEFTYTRFCLSLPDSPPRTYFVRMQPGAQLVVIQDGQSRRIGSRVDGHHKSVFFPNLKLGQVRTFDSNSGNAQDITGAKSETEATLAEAADGVGLGMQIPTGIARWAKDSFLYVDGERRHSGQITAWAAGHPAVIEYSLTCPESSDSGGQLSTHRWRMQYSYGTSPGVPPQFPSQIVATHQRGNQWAPIWRYVVSALRVADSPLPPSAYDPMPFAHYPLIEVFAENGKMFVRGGGRTERLYAVPQAGTIYPERERRSKLVYYAFAGLFALWPAYILFMAYRTGKRRQSEMVERS